MAMNTERIAPAMRLLLAVWRRKCISAPVLFQAASLAEHSISILDLRFFRWILAGKAARQANWRSDMIEERQPSRQSSQRAAGGK
jgi:hypothetical protein